MVIRRVWGWADEPVLEWVDGQVPTAGGGDTETGVELKGRTVSTDDCGEPIVLHRIVGSLAAAKVSGRDQQGAVEVLLPEQYVLDLELSTKRGYVPLDTVVLHVPLTEEDALKLPKLSQGRTAELTIRILPKQPKQPQQQPPPQSQPAPVVPREGRRGGRR